MQLCVQKGLAGSGEGGKLPSVWAEEVRRCGRVQSVRRGVSTRRAVEECTADRVGHTIMCTPGCFQRGAIWMKVGVALQESPAWER